MEAETTRQPSGWRTHDLVTGFLAGTGLGLVASIFVIARVLDHRAVLIVGVGLGAGAGLYAADRLSRDGGGVAPWRVITWVVIVLTYGFVALLIMAIRNLN